MISVEKRVDIKGQKSKLGSIVGNLEPEFNMGSIDINGGIFNI